MSQATRKHGPWIFDLPSRTRPIIDRCANELALSRNFRRTLEDVNPSGGGPWDYSDNLAVGTVKVLSRPTILGPRAKASCRDSVLTLAMDLRPIPDHAALLIDGTILAVADLHIGIEEELTEAGVHIPPQADRMAKEVEALAAQYRATTLVVLGDVKHFVPKMASRERRDVFLFFQRLLETFDAIYVAQGNHDGLLRHVVPRAVKFRASPGFVLGDVGFCHGHAWPYRKVMAAKALVMGHNHPAVAFRDAMGSRTIQPCWMRIPFRRRHKRYAKLPREAVVVPALNELCGGVPVNDLRVNFLGPLFDPALLRTDDADIHLLDGTHLGKLREIRVDAGFRREDYRQ